MDGEQLERVIEEVRSGNTKEFSKIVTAFQKQLFSYVYCIVNNTHDAEDILQETYVTAYHKLHQYKENTMFSAWLYRIAKNLALDHLKKRNRMKPYEREEMERLSEEYTFLDYNEGYDEAITKTLKQMTFQENNILVLRIHQEKSYEEIAYIINKSESTARKQYERAKKKFAKLYEELNKEELPNECRKQIKGVL